MNLVCFSNNTAGGLVCDLLNGNSVEMLGYKTTNQEHSAFKILDTPRIQRTFYLAAWNHKLAQFADSDKWLGTHFHPSVIPNLSAFNKVIAITTESRESKLFRWLRYYHGWFKNNTPNWRETDDLDTIDKIRELAKDVFEPFEPHPQCKNIEFKDIVNGNFIKAENLDLLQFAVWQEANPWLYDTNITWAVKRFNEAEWEITHQQPYKYL